MGKVSAGIEETLQDCGLMRVFVVQIGLQWVLREKKVGKRGSANGSITYDSRRCHSRIGAELSEMRLDRIEVVAEVWETLAVLTPNVDRKSKQS